MVLQLLIQVTHTFLRMQLLVVIQLFTQERVIEGNTVIGSDCEIGPHTVIRDSEIGDRTVIRQSSCT